jgi:hypothetical protein
LDKAKALFLDASFSLEGELTAVVVSKSWTLASEWGTIIGMVD